MGPKPAEGQQNNQAKKRPPQGSLPDSAPKRPKPNTTARAPPRNGNDKAPRPNVDTGPNQASSNRSSHKPSGAPKVQPSQPSTNKSSRPGQGNGQGGPRKGQQTTDGQPAGRFGVRPNMREVRAIAVQRQDPAVQDGQLNVQAFVDSRAFELKALTESMRRTKASSTSRAFQIVPVTLRRRTAAHNYKRVPKRLQARAKKEMLQDNTPIVNSRTRKPTSTRNRLRAENARRLGLVMKRKKLRKLAKSGADAATISLRAARPKIRRNTPNDPVVTNRKFRRRQMHKTWLPTHMWHTKRARMTDPKNPLWRFAIPLTPSNKSYRPTHRAQFEQGALAWDMSYMSTIGLAGALGSVRNVLKAIGLEQDRLWNERGQRWQSGAVHWSGLLSRNTGDKRYVIGPATVLWNPEPEIRGEDSGKDHRRLFIRLHPSIFLEVFNELLRLARMNNPRPYIEDLRYEVGSIEVIGPNSTEALIAVLKQYGNPSTSPSQPCQTKFHSLAGLKDPAALPIGALFSFSATDPRLHYPFSPRRVLPTVDPDPQSKSALHDLLGTFHTEPAGPPIELFDRDSRFKASKLPSQKSLNRRKGKGAPGARLKPTSSDPPIPLIALASRHPTDPQSPGSWTVMLPWKCVLPIWYCLMHYPLSCGGNPRFGGLDELRQLTFERGLPWFPGDVPGTVAGNAWELEQRSLREKKWQRMPKGKRHNYETLDLGAGRKGEVGHGWKCDYETILDATITIPQKDIPDKDEEDVLMADDEENADTPTKETNSLSTVDHLSRVAFNALLSQKPTPSIPSTGLVSVRIKMVTRGTPSTCARVYRLPTIPTSGLHEATASSAKQQTQGSADIPATNPPSQSKIPLPSDLYEQWLSLQPSKPKSATRNKNGGYGNAVPASKKRGLTVEDRQRLIARQLLTPPTDSQVSATVINGDHPVCPDEHDLIGFVTRGEFNLRDGRGEAIGNLSATKAAEELRRYETIRGKGKDGDRAKANGHAAATRLCIVREAGEAVGRLARWELVGF